MAVPPASNDCTESHECARRLKVIEPEDESDEAVAARSSICLVDDRHIPLRACPLSGPGVARSCGHTTGNFRRDPALGTAGMPEAQQVSPIEFTTRGVPIRQQFEAWLGWHDRTFDASPDRPASEGFVADSRSLAMQGFALVRVSAPAMKVMRTRALIRRNPVDHFLITLGLDVPTRLIAEGIARVVPAGSPFVVSLGHEVVSARGAGERLRLYLPRDSFRDIVPVLEAARGAVASGPMGTLLAEYLK